MYKHFFLYAHIPVSNIFLQNRYAIIFIFKMTIKKTFYCYENIPYPQIWMTIKCQNFDIFSICKCNINFSIHILDCRPKCVLRDVKVIIVPFHYTLIYHSLKCRPYRPTVQSRRFQHHYYHIFRLKRFTYCVFLSIQIYLIFVHNIVYLLLSSFYCCFSYIVYNIR